MQGKTAAEVGFHDACRLAGNAQSARKCRSRPTGSALTSGDARSDSEPSVSIVFRTLKFPSAYGAPPALRLRRCR
jgi:hypothetical protein